eukprot:g20959.t1
MKEVIKLAGELEDIWRDQVGDLNEFDGAKLAGLWELVYSTSVKFRRWGSVLNAVRDIKDAKFEALIQNFAVRVQTTGSMSMTWRKFSRLRSEKK